MIHLGWNSICNGFMNEIWKVGRIFNLETIFIRPGYCSLWYFTPRYISFGLKPLLLTQFRMYQIYLSSQSSVFTVILNQTIHQRALNPYQQPISEKAKNTLLFVTIKTFSFCNLIYLIMVYFTFMYFISDLIYFY